MSVTFKKKAINLREFIAGVFKPKYREKVETKWASNLIKNGTFDFDYSEWTASSNATLTVTSGELSVDTIATSGGNAYAWQLLNVEVGKTYRINLTTRRVDSTDVRIWVGTTLSGAQYMTLSTVSTSNVTLTGTFVATSTKLYVHLAAFGNTAGHTAIFDNISVREVMPNLVTNGDFASTTNGWTAAAAWVSSGSALVGTATGGVIESITQTIDTIVDKTYIITYDVNAVTGNDVIVNVGTSLAGESILTTGQKTHVFRSDTSSEILQFRFTSLATGGDTITIDNVVVRELSVDIPLESEVTHVWSNGSRVIPVDYEEFSNGTSKQVNFKHDVDGTDLAVDYMVKL